MKSIQELTSLNSISNAADFELLLHNSRGNPSMISVENFIKHGSGAITLFDEYKDLASLYSGAGENNTKLVSPWVGNNAKTAITQFYFHRGRRGSAVLRVYTDPTQDKYYQYIVSSTGHNSGGATSNVGISVYMPIIEGYIHYWLQTHNGEQVDGKLLGYIT